jgi:hypothetical protein
MDDVLLAWAFDGLGFGLYTEATRGLDNEDEDEPVLVYGSTRTHIYMPKRPKNDDEEVFFVVEEALKFLMNQ